MNYEYLEMVNAELMMAASCNLSCTYCFIGKCDALKKVDEQIVKEFEEKGVYEKIRESYSENIELLGLWGSEPTLFLDYFIAEVGKIISGFPRLGTIFISSNFLSPRSVEKLIKLVEAVSSNAPEDRKIMIEIQSSLDGPPEITDRTRKTAKNECSSQPVVKNIEDFIVKMKDVELHQNVTVEQTFKPTVDKDAISDIVNEKISLESYFQLFDDILDLYHGSKDEFPQGYCFIPICTPTIVDPDEYTSVHGKEYVVFLDMLKNLALVEDKAQLYRHVRIKNSIPYFSTFIEYHDVYKIYQEQNQGFSCGAGGRGYSLGLNRMAHPCHRLFYLDQEGYIEFLKSQGEDCVFEEQILKEHIVKNDDELDFLKQRYVMSATRDFFQFKYNAHYAMLKQLALCGQASSRYLYDDDFCELAAKFITGMNKCMAGAYLENGSYFVPPIGQVRLFGNGAIEKYIEIYKDFKRRGMIRK